MGCILYFLVLGRPPFAAATDFLAFEKIKKLDYTEPEGIDADAKDLVHRIIVRFEQQSSIIHLLDFLLQVAEPTDRLGVGPKSSVTALRQHPFFVGHDQTPHTKETFVVDWETIWTVEPVVLESGVVPPPPMEDKEHFWDDFVRSLNDALGDAEFSPDSDFNQHNRTV
jgi:3-phosphoinositide dependent protein kinase-1